MSIETESAYVLLPSRTQVRVGGVTFAPESPKSKDESIETAARIVASWNTYRGVPLEAMNQGGIPRASKAAVELSKAILARDLAKLPGLVKELDEALERLHSNMGKRSSTNDLVYLVAPKEGRPEIVQDRPKAFTETGVHRKHVTASAGNSFDVGGKAGTRWRPVDKGKASFETVQAVVKRIEFLFNASEGERTLPLARGVTVQLSNAERSLLEAVHRMGPKSGQKWTVERLEKHSLDPDAKRVLAAYDALAEATDWSRGRLHDCAECLAQAPQGKKVKPAAAQPKPAQRPATPKVEPAPKKRPVPRVEPAPEKRPAPRVEPVAAKKPSAPKSAVPWAGEIKWFI